MKKKCKLLDYTINENEEKVCEFCDALKDACDRSAIIKKAFEYVKKAHDGQYRKGTTIPYLIHLVRTFGYANYITEDEEILAAALLHDTIEDTGATYQTLNEEFGEKISRYVNEESENKRENIPAKDTWRTRKQETLDRLRKITMDEEAYPEMVITFSDKMANMYSIMYEYRQKGDFIWKKFNQKNKHMHAWYYGEMYLIFREYFGWISPDSQEIRELLDKYEEYYTETFGKLQ